MLSFLVQNLWYVMFALFATSFVWRLVTRRMRRRALVGFAEQREWHYEPDDSVLESRFRGEPFDRGDGRRATNVLTGSYEGHEFVAFDYTFRTGSGEHRRTHEHSVVAIELGMPPGVVVPRLQVSPQGPLGRFLSGLTGTDVEIGHPAFDAAFEVRTDSPQFARDVIGPDLADLLLRHRGRAWRLDGACLLLVDEGTHTPEEVDGVLAWGTAILERVPNRVWATLRGDV